MLREKVSFEEAITEKVGLRLSKTDSGIEQLWETKDERGESALERAAFFESVALQLIQTQKGREKLAQVNYIGKRPILFDVLRTTKSVADELVATPEGRKYLADTKDSSSDWSGLHNVCYYYDDLSFKLREADPELLKSTVTTAGFSAWESAQRNVDYVSYRSGLRNDKKHRYT